MAAALKFGRWETPFENAEITVLDAAFVSGESSPNEQSVARSLVVRVFDHDRDVTYSVRFADVVGFRVLDEGGLLELWGATASQGGRPGRSTFRVKGHGWTHESPLTFVAAERGDGSYVIASDWDCVEIVTSDLPIIEAET